MYKLLICDDERTIREGIQQSIDWKTLHVDLVGTAKDGEEGWAWVKKHAPELVIADIRMPKMDGIELLKNITVEFPHTKVLLLSGYSDFKYAQQGLRFHAFDYLLKPTNPEAIKDSLESAILTYETEWGIEREKEIAAEDRYVPLANHSEAVTHYIDEHYREEITLESAAAHLYVSAGHLNRILKKTTNHTFLSYLTKVRIEHAKQLLATKRYTVYEVCAMAGYRDSKYFSQLFRKLVGMTPSEYMQLFKING
jgi:two-component system response regulator YesN